MIMRRMMPTLLLTPLRAVTVVPEMIHGLFVHENPGIMFLVIMRKLQALEKIIVHVKVITGLHPPP